MIFLAAEKCATEGTAWPAAVGTIAVCAMIAFIAWCVTR